MIAWAISYAYTNDAAEAQRIARQAADRRHLYGTNAESQGAGALDPTINTFDLGEDPLAWGRDRSTLVRNIITNLPKHVLTDNSSPYEVTAAYGSLMQEYARAVAPAVKYIGGAYINRDHVGRPECASAVRRDPEGEAARGARLPRRSRVRARTR